LMAEQKTKATAKDVVQKTDRVEDRTEAKTKDAVAQTRGDVRETQSSTTHGVVDGVKQTSVNSSTDASSDSTVSASKHNQKVDSNANAQNQTDANVMGKQMSAGAAQSGQAASQTQITKGAFSDQSAAGTQTSVVGKKK
jgi:hypothetical protein